MRPVEEWADRVYGAGGEFQHVLPFGDQLPLCGQAETVWFGTGNWEEIEHAEQLPMCQDCGQRILPKVIASDPAVEIWTETMRERGTDAFA